MMVERRCHLDEPLQECLFRALGVQPDLLPGFVGFEEMAGVKQGDAVGEEIR